MLRIALGIILALFISNIVTYNLWQNNKSALLSEQKAHAETVQHFKTAQEVADVRAKAIKDTLEKEAKKDAEQADANYANLLNKYNASLLRYQASQSRTGGPSDYQLPATQSGNGPSGGTELSERLIISLTDAKICAVNTARLQSVHEWAVRLPKE